MYDFFSSSFLFLEASRSLAYRIILYRVNRILKHENDLFVSFSALI
jgi:hypothetical protein